MPWPGTLVASVSYVVPTTFRHLSEFLTAWRNEHLRDTFPVIPDRPAPTGLLAYPLTRSGPYRLRVQIYNDSLPGFGRAPNNVIVGVVAHPDCPNGCEDHRTTHAIIMVIECLPPLGDDVPDTQLWIECYQAAALSLYDDLTTRLLQRWPAAATRKQHDWRHPDCSPPLEVVDSATFTINGASVRDLAGDLSAGVVGWFERHTTESEQVELFHPRLATVPVSLYMAWYPHNESTQFIGPDSERLTTPAGLTRVRLAGDFYLLPITADRKVSVTATILDIIQFDLERLADNRTKVYARCYYGPAIPYFHKLVRALRSDYHGMITLDEEQRASRQPTASPDPVTEVTLNVRPAQLEDIEGWFCAYMGEHFGAGQVIQDTPERIMLASFEHSGAFAFGRPDTERRRRVSLGATVWATNPAGQSELAELFTLALDVNLWRRGERVEVTAACNFEAALPHFHAMLEAFRWDYRFELLPEGASTVRDATVQHDHASRRITSDARSQTSSNVPDQNRKSVRAGRSKGTTEVFVSKEHFLEAISEAAKAIRSRRQYPSKERIAEYFAENPSLLGEQRNTGEGVFHTENLDRARKRYGFPSWSDALSTAEAED